MVTHIGDGCRAAGFLPIANAAKSSAHSVDSGDSDLSTFATGCYPTQRASAEGAAATSTGTPPARAHLLNF